MKISKGFTLVELVIVIAIIGILAGIAIPMYQDAQSKARGARIVADMATIQSAYTIYLAKTGTQPKIIQGNASYNEDIIPLLVKEGYLAYTPVPPIGKAIFADAQDAYKNFTVSNDASYLFINHAAVSTRDILVAIDPGWGDPQPITRFTNNY